MAKGLISEAMLGLIGAVQQRLTSYPICASDIRRWALAVYYPNDPPERYLRAGAAAGEPPLTAPEEFNPFAWATPGPRPEIDGYSGPKYIEERAGIAPPDISFIVNGGTACEYGAPMREGDVITAESRIKSYAQRQGKQGPLLFTDIEDRWTNQRGETVKVTVQTMIRY